MPAQGSGCGAVDLCERRLALWDTKFFKARGVPRGEDLGRALGTYRQGRASLPQPAGVRSAFLAARRGDAGARQQLEKVFRRLRQHAGLRRPATERWHPRRHDLRHTRAVHRGIAWYREGGDVDARLPLLAAYLGHVNVSGTPLSRTLTPELLAEASWRFERYAAGGQEHTHGYPAPERSVRPSLFTGRGWKSAPPESPYPAPLS